MPSSSCKVFYNKFSTSDVKIHIGKRKKENKTPKKKQKKRLGESFHHKHKGINKIQLHEI